MKRLLLTLLILSMTLTPIVGAVTIQGPTNFIGPHGGIVRFDDTVTTTRINVVNTIWRFLTFTDGGVNRGTLAFDCSTGCNMTILSVNLYEITYNVSAVGASTQYVMYRNNDHAPQGTNTDTITYNAATDTATVTTTGSVIVTLDYATLSGIGINGLEYFLSIFPLIAFFGALEARKRDIIGNRIVVAALVFAVAAIVLLVIRVTGA